MTCLARLARCLLALAPVLALGSALAGTPSTEAIEQQIRQFAQAGTQSAVAAAGGVTRVEIEVGQLDPRLRLAPCQRVQPWMPPGARLWGRSRIGLRCAEGATHWNVYLPITVHVFARAQVAAVALPAGSTVAAGDLREAEVDLAAAPSAAVRLPAAAVGRTLARALSPGEPVRESHLRARQWFAAGDTVRLVARGRGFAIAGEGRALTNGIEGRTARVRIDSGRVLTGEPVGERRMELSL